MLPNTFRHLPRVGQKTEEALWAAGLLDWNSALAAAELPVPRTMDYALRKGVEESAKRLGERDARWFAQRLPAGEQWRLFPHFADKAAYIDIETTGGLHGQDHITTIALYDGREARWWVFGQDLESFLDCVLQYELLVTFNGKCFDIPFIERLFGAKIDIAHLDLRYPLKRAGLSGGLKACEKRLGLDRGDLDGVDGFHAVLLWEEYVRSGDARFLETLLAYNVEDVINLAALAAHAYNLLAAQTPLALPRLESPAPPPNPLTPDRGIIASLRASIQGMRPRYW